jgi:hypothetical protein
MKQSKRMIMTFASGAILACTPVSEPVSETVPLLRNLHKIPLTGFMFGHQDDTAYGIGWDGIAGELFASDVNLYE